MFLFIARVVCECSTLINQWRIHPPLLWCLMLQHLFFFFSTSSSHCLKQNPLGLCVSYFHEERRRQSSFTAESLVCVNYLMNSHYLREHVGVQLRICGRRWVRDIFFIVSLILLFISLLPFELSCFSSDWGPLTKSMAKKIPLDSHHQFVFGSNLQKQYRMPPRHDETVTGVLVWVLFTRRKLPSEKQCEFGSFNDDIKAHHPGCDNLSMSVMMAALRSPPLILAMLSSIQVSEREDARLNAPLRWISPCITVEKWNFSQWRTRHFFWLAQMIRSVWRWRRPRAEIRSIRERSKATSTGHPVQPGSCRTSWRRMERGRERTRGSSCGRSVVAAAKPDASACPIDFSSTANWTIFHTVLQRPHLPFYLFPHSAEPHVSSLGNHRHTLTTHCLANLNV